MFIKIENQLNKQPCYIKEKEVHSFGYGTVGYQGKKATGVGVIIKGQSEVIFLNETSVAEFANKLFNCLKAKGE